MTDGLPGIRRVEHVMGMPIVVDLRDDDLRGPDALDELFAWFRWVDDTFSTFKKDSEISRLNGCELALEDTHPDVRRVLARCEELRDETSGYFDVHAASPDAIDPAGLVKGWSVDRGAELLDDAGLRNYAINAGGDIRLRGRAIPEWTWRVGIEHPLRNDMVAKVVEANDLAIATSGEYARGAHISVPHTRRPPGGIHSVTVTGPDLANADAYATAAFAMGALRGPRWTARLRGYQALTILADGRVLSTPGFPSVDDEPASGGTPTGLAA
jgi:thiamine biosynthesis lipoprotein